MVQSMTECGGRKSHSGEVAHFCPLTASGRVVNGIAAVLWELMSTTEKHQFQAEIQQLLDIVIHSYTPTKKYSFAN